MREPHLFTARWIFRRDEIQHIYRLLRVCWCRGAPGTGYGYSAKFTVALSARPFEWCRDTRTDIILAAFWLRFHYSRSYGGRFAP
jgi:hypothetical protein